MIENEEIEIKRIKCTNQPADVMTKSLQVMVEKHKRFIMNLK